MVCWNSFSILFSVHIFFKHLPCTRLRMHGRARVGHCISGPLEIIEGKEQVIFPRWGGLFGGDSNMSDLRGSVCSLLRQSLSNIWVECLVCMLFWGTQCLLRGVFYFGARWSTKTHQVNMLCTPSSKGHLLSFLHTMPSQPWKTGTLPTCVKWQM